MVKSSDHHATVEEEFSKLELALNQTAGDTSVCLRLLKKQLSEYDHRNGNIFTHSATSYLRSDMRLAKDTANELKHVAHQISHSPKPSKSEVASARHSMNETSRVMEALTTTARNYDKENGQSKGIKGTIDTMIGGHHDKDEHEKHEDKKHGGLFGDKKEGHHGGLSSHADKNGGGIMGTTETVEGLVQKNLRENFNTKALDHQISVAEKALSPSIMERAKEAIHDVKDKLKGDKTSPTHGPHGHGEHGHGGSAGTHLRGGPTQADHVHGGGPVGTHPQGGAVGSPAYGGPNHRDHVPGGGGPVGTHLQGEAVGSHRLGGPTHGDHVLGGGPVGTHLQGGPVGSRGLGGPIHGDPTHGGHHSTHPSTHSTAL